jgi:OmpA-OmpF porin, OOP family
MRLKMGKILKRIYLAVILLSLVPIFSNAEQLRPKERDYNLFIFSPFAGGYLFQPGQRYGFNTPNYDLSDSYSVGLRAGYGISRNFDIEGTFNYIPTSHNIGDLNLFLYHADLVYNILNSGRYTPYIDLGFGGARFSPQGGRDGNFFLISYAAGLKVFLIENLAIRADLRGYTKFDKTFTNFNFTLGISYFFGIRKQDLDPDRDGIVNRFDLCPNQAEDFEGYLDEDGCPETGNKQDPLKGMCEPKK